MSRPCIDDGRHLSTISHNVLAILLPLPGEKGFHDLINSTRSNEMGKKIVKYGLTGLTGVATVPAFIY
jgi:hypothetical protein